VLIIVVVIVIVMVVIVVILVPIALGFPPVFSPVPPLVILIPTTLPLLIQSPTPFLGLVAVLTIPLDRSVQSRLRLFDGMLALPSIVVGVRPRCCNKK
jgi:hypothetical protein